MERLLKNSLRPGVAKDCPVKFKSTFIYAMRPKTMLDLICDTKQYERGSKNSSSEISQMRQIASRCT